MNKGHPPHWAQMSLDDQRTYVRGFFMTGAIKQATRAQLEDCLVTMANAPRDWKKDEDRDEQERFSVAIRQLLQTRISEELHRRSVRLSWIAIGVSTAALLITGFRAWEEHRSLIRKELSAPRESASGLPAPK